MNHIENKMVLVTGADGGLGVPVVTSLLAAGWHVWAFLRREGKQEEFKKKFKNALNNLSFIIGDVTSEKDVVRATEQIKDPAALVHLAGGFAAARSFADQDEKVFDRMFNLNTRSTFFLLKAMLPVMKKNNKGSIVTIGAKPAQHIGADNALYAASKAALINMTLTAAEEGRPHDVRANVIIPAVIRTQASMQWASSEEEVSKWTPPEAIADLVRWLISEESKHVTGTAIPMFHHMKP